MSSYLGVCARKRIPVFIDKTDFKMVFRSFSVTYVSSLLFILLSTTMSSVIPAVQGSDRNTRNASRLPIVFVYKVSNSLCKHGLPAYIKVSLEQAITTQYDCDIVLASNFGQCPKISEAIKKLQNVTLFDISNISSPRATDFMASTKSLLSGDHDGLWQTSAHRLFYIEELMLQLQYTEILHVEADNMLYGRISEILPVLRTQYPALAATPLIANGFTTASVLWIAHIDALHVFNNFLLDLSMNSSGSKKFQKWLGDWASKNKQRVTAYHINEMAMLAYYQSSNPYQLASFAVVPALNCTSNTSTCSRLLDYSPGGVKVGAKTGPGIWDPGSWGQNLGGTREPSSWGKGFRDLHHIAGQAIENFQCRSEMVCKNSSSYVINSDTIKGVQWCTTAPFVRCADSDVWTPLWNLHVHSKNTHLFRSRPCSCI